MTGNELMEELKKCDGSKEIEIRIGEEQVSSSLKSVHEFTDVIRLENPAAFLPEGGVVHPAQVMLREILDELIDVAGADKRIAIPSSMYRKALDMSRPKRLWQPEPKPQPAVMTAQAYRLQQFWTEPSEGSECYDLIITEGEANQLRETIEWLKERSPDWGNTMPSFELFTFDDKCKRPLRFNEMMDRLVTESRYDDTPETLGELYDLTKGRNALLDAAFAARKVKK